MKPGESPARPGVRVVKGGHTDSRGRGRVQMLEDLRKGLRRLDAAAEEDLHEARLGRPVKNRSAIMSVPELVHLIFMIFEPQPAAEGA